MLENLSTGKKAPSTMNALAWCIWEGIGIEIPT